jgi:hypothetical protein
MSTHSLASNCFNFSTSDPSSVSRAFVAHIERFQRQNRDVSWQDAPFAFAGVYAEGNEESTTNLFRRAMEDLLDAGAISVERLQDGSNRLRNGAAAGGQKQTLALNAHDRV